MAKLPLHTSSLVWLSYYYLSMKFVWLNKGCMVGGHLARFDLFPPYWADLKLSCQSSVEEARKRSKPADVTGILKLRKSRWQIPWLAEGLLAYQEELFYTKLRSSVKNWRNTEQIVYCYFKILCTLTTVQTKLKQLKMNQIVSVVRTPSYYFTELSLPIVVLIFLGAILPSVDNKLSTVESDLFSDFGKILVDS